MIEKEETTPGQHQLFLILRNFSTENTHLPGTLHLPKQQTNKHPEAVSFTLNFQQQNTPNYQGQTLSR